jgi:hypothetical protein
LGVQYEHNRRFNRCANYACQVDKEDSQKADDIFVDGSFSSNDDPAGPE